MAVVFPPQSNPPYSRHKLLEALRSDVIHYDSKEKHHRIVFSIREYLTQHPDDDTQLTKALQRILEIVESFRKSASIVLPPEKQGEVLQKSESDKELREKFQEIFRLLNEQSSTS